jgi:5-methylthioadenosine/S-adenosylhomocysteine deaminase
VSAAREGVRMRERLVADLLLRARAVVTMNPGREVISNGAVAVTNSKIVAIDNAAELSERVSARRVIDAQDGVLTPGLIDAHNHPQDTLLRGVLDDLGPGERRMTSYVFPYEHGISDDEAYLASQATFAEMLLNGTTCFCDAGGPTPDGVARAALDVGIRGGIARRGNDLPGPMLCPVTGDAETVLMRASETVDRWNGAADGRLRGYYNLDLPDNATDEFCISVVESAAQRNVGIVGHLVGEVHRSDTSTRRQRFSDVERLEQLGVLGPNLTLAHIGWIHEEDVAAFARHEVNAVHCPSQSMFGATGVVGHGSIPELVGAGVTVGLGTDASCISRFLDLVRVMYLAACAHRDVRMDPLVIGAHKAFEMGTIDGARALGWEDKIGSLEVGKEADIVVFDASGLEWWPDPFGDPVNNLVYSSSGRSARTVLVGGRILVEDGVLTTIDARALGRELSDLRPFVLDRLGLGAGQRSRPW